MKVATNERTDRDLKGRLSSLTKRCISSNVRLHRAAPIFALAAGIPLQGCGSHSKPPAVQPVESVNVEIMELTDSLQPLQQQFNRDRGKLRAMALFSPTCSGCVYGAQAVQSEIVEMAHDADIQVYFVWMPMLPTDHKGAAEEMIRSLSTEDALHFYDPERLAGVQFVEDHFDAFMKKALAVLPDDDPYRKQLGSLAAAPAGEKPLWDALILFAPDAEWGESLPAPDWWTRQVDFSSTAAEGKPTGQFWRSGASRGLLMSDWFDEVREGLKTMNAQISR